jgi:hypothetical protein
LASLGFRIAGGGGGCISTTHAHATEINQKKFWREKTKLHHSFLSLILLFLLILFFLRKFEFFCKPLKVFFYLKRGD